MLRMLPMLHSGPQVRCLPTRRISIAGSLRAWRLRDTLSGRSGFKLPLNDKNPSTITRLGDDQ